MARRLPNRNPKDTAWGLPITPRPDWFREAVEIATAQNPEIQTADDVSYYTTGSLWFLIVRWGVEGKSYRLGKPA